MKLLRENKNVIQKICLIALVLGMLILAMIGTNIMIKNKAYADYCPYTEGQHDFSVCQNYGGEHWYQCVYCGEKDVYSVTACSWEDWTPMNEYHHMRRCTYEPCDASQVEEHYDNDYDGECDACHYPMTTQATCAYNQHSYARNWNYENHWLECEYCHDLQDIEGHDLTPWVADNTICHSRECRVCGFSNTIPHEDSDGNGYCDDCGYYMNAVLECSTSPTGNHEFVLIDKNSNSHWYYCKYCGTIDQSSIEAHKYNSNSNIYGYDMGGHYRICSVCGEKVPGTEAPHMGGTHSNGGVCTLCGCTYQNHSLRTTPSGYTNITATTHTPIYGCTFPGCQETHVGSPEAHRDLNHDNKCDDCGESTVTNGNTTTVHTHTPGICVEIDENYHIRICSECGLPIVETVSPHTIGPEYINEFPTCTTNGLKVCYCTGCGKVMATQVLSMLGHDYKKEANAQGHWDVCTRCGQTEMVETHIGGTHANGGKCTVCEFVYQDHTFKTTPVRYEKTETTHTPIYECNCAGCPETKTGTAEKHKDSNKDGKCDVCGYEVGIPHTTHTPKEAWEMNSTEHWKICTECGEEINGTRGTHTGATHSNGGKCTVCGYKYENHGKSSTVKSYTDITENKHTPVYKCICDGCTKTYKGTAENHIDADGDNKCDACGYEMPVPHTTHTPKEEWEKDGTDHWKVCSECGEEIEGTRATHTGATHSNGGKCTVCGYKYENHGRSNTVKEYIEKTETTHTPVYGCICEGCTATYKGTAENHVDTDGDNKCDACGYEITVSHTTHTPKTEWEKDETNHWKICKDCGAEIEGTRAAHKDENNDKICDVCEYNMNTTNNNGDSQNNNDDPQNNNTQGENKTNTNQKDGDTDKTKTTKEIPNTGVKAITVLSIILSGLVATGFVGMKKYTGV